MERTEFSARLQQGPLLVDGAMGTLLHTRGLVLDACFDAVNQTDPGLVAAVHGDYIDAGADIIETNSFSANRYKLALHGREEDVAAINVAAVTVARRAIDSRFKSVLLAGSIGPLGARLAPLGRVPAVAAEAAFREQIEALVFPERHGADTTGVDLLLVETMSALPEVAAVVTAARDVAPDVPLVVQMTFTRDDRTLMGLTPADVANGLKALAVDAIGVNCSGGPAQILRLVAAMRALVGELPLAVSPNAGWPERSSGGRVLYPATPAYFGDYARSFAAAGIKLIGGCCGTTPAHTAAMRAALDDAGPVVHPLPAVTVINRPDEADDTAVVDPPTALAGALAAGRFIATVEMRPPKGIAAQQLLAGAEMLQAAGANFLNIADNPLARMRMSAWAAAHLVQKARGMETILHFPTRGRNLLRIQGDLLAAHALGIRNLFVVMGDPTRIGDYPEAMDGYDIVPTGLIQLIKKRLNAGVDQAEQPIDQPTNFTVGCALGLESDNPERQLKLLRKKIKNGADFALTQPVFNPEVALSFLERCRAELGDEMIPVIAGVQALYNQRNAEFLHHEVPGITISTAYRERLRQAEDAQAAGVGIAREIVAAIRPAVQGVYLVPAFGRYDLVADVLDMVSAPAPV